MKKFQKKINRKLEKKQKKNSVKKDDRVTKTYMKQEKIQWIVK